MEEKMKARMQASKLVCEEVSKTNPLQGLSPDQMVGVNARNVPYQDALRKALALGYAMDQPHVAFAAAIEAVMTVLSTMEQTEQTRESLAYVMTLIQAVTSMPEGPKALMVGELDLSAVIHEDDLTPEQKAQLGGKQVAIEREGNVIDASSIFRPSNTVH